MKQSVKISIIEAFLHVAAWALVCVVPMLIAREILNEGFELSYLAVFSLPIVLMLIFYINYALLIPRLLFKSKTWIFALCNVALVVCLSYSLYYIHTSAHSPFKPRQEFVNGEGMDGHRPPLPNDERHPRRPNPMDDDKPFDGPKEHERNHMHKPKGVIRFVNDVLVMLFVCLISILLRYTKRWFLSFSQMKELEKEKVEVELKNLKSQLNPHFLFNTLNNIFALISINQDKAQQAVLDLSKLLRYALYEGNQSNVTLEKEVEFINNYVKLMKLRLANSVAVNTSFNIGIHGNLPIAQMLFITLVENAFKHGVSLTQDSFIDMKMDVDDDKKCVFVIENSSFPKGEQDKSGSGIGIENLKRRLELLYPGRYSYDVTDDGLRYKVVLALNLNNCL